MIELRNVHAAYDDQLPVLRDVSFTIADGEFVAFVGTNGAGKSTTMRLMNGLLKPSEGTVLLNGIPTTELRTSCLLYTSRCVEETGPTIPTCSSWKYPSIVWSASGVRMRVSSVMKKKYSLESCSTAKFARRA